MVKWMKRWRLFGAAMLLAALGLVTAVAARPAADDLVTVGRRPMAVAVDARARHAFVVNRLSDTVSIIDMATSRLVRTVPVGLFPSAIALDATRGRAIVINQVVGRRATVGSLSILDTREGRVIRTIRMGGQPIGVACDEALGRSFVMMTSGAVAVVDTTSGSLLTTVRGGPSPAALVVDDRRHRAFPTDHSGAAYALDARSGRVLWMRKVGQMLQPVAVDRPTGHIFVGDRWAAQVLTLDGDTGRVLDTVPVGQGLDPLHIAVDERTRRVFVLSQNNADGAPGMVSVLDAGTGGLVGATTVGETPSNLAVDDTAQRVYVTNAGSNTLSVLDARNGRVVRTVPVMEDSYLLALDTPARQLVVVAGDVTASTRLARLRQPSPLARIEVLIGRYKAGGTARVFDTRTLQ